MKDKAKAAARAMVVVLLAGLVLLFGMAIGDEIRKSMRKHAATEARLVAVLGRLQAEKDAAEALRVLYGVSEPEAKMLAGEFLLAESDTVPWVVYAAVCRVESGFDPTLTSRAGCKGLMQLSDSTGARTARAHGLKWRPRTAPWSDALNVRVGCIYLRDVASRHGVGTAVKMYLAGEPNIKRKPGMVEAGEYAAKVVEEMERLKYIYVGIRAGGGRK